MNSIKNIARVAGLLYVFIEIFGFSSSLYVPTNSSHAAPVWLAMNSILGGLVGRVEIVGGLWVLLITWGALLAGRLPKRLNYLGVVTGVAGILTVVPALEVLGIGFRLGEIVWSVWLGIVIFRRRGGVGVAPRELHGQPAILEHTEHASVVHAVPKVAVAEADEKCGLPGGQLRVSGAQLLAQRPEGR